MELEEKMQDASFVEVSSQTSTEFRSPPNLPAILTAGSVPAALEQDDPPEQEWTKNYPNLVQFSDSETARAAINSIALRCAKCDRLSGDITKGLWLAVAEAVVIFHLSDQKTIDAVCRDAGIKKASKRANGKRPLRHYVRLVTGRIDDPSFSEREKSNNDKEVGRFARYFEKCLDRIEENHWNFCTNPVEKLYNIIEENYGLERFVKGDEVEVDGHSSKSAYKPQNIKPIASAPVTATPHSTTTEEAEENEADDLTSTTEKPTVQTAVQTTQAKAEMRTEWMKRYIPRVAGLPTVQEFNLKPALQVAHNGIAVLLGRCTNSSFNIFSMETDSAFVEEAIWRAASTNKKLAPRLVRTLADIMSTRLFPETHLKPGTALLKQQDAIIKKLRLALASPDTFVLSEANSLASVVVRCRLKASAIAGNFCQLRLAEDLLASAVALARRSDIGQCVADNTLELTVGTASKDPQVLLVKWEDDPADGFYFEPITGRDWQADFRFAEFEAAHVSTIEPLELSKLHGTVLEPWTAAIAKSQQADRANASVVDISIGKQFVMEVNGVPHSFAHHVTKEPQDILKLAIHSADVLPVLWFISSASGSTRIDASYEGIVFTIELDYAELRIFVPALKPDRKTLRDDLFSRFPMTA